MIQMIVIGFFVCLGVKAATDVYDGGKKILLSDEVKKSFKDGAHKVADAAHLGKKVEEKKQ